MPFVKYEGWGGECSGKTQPGTLALRDFIRYDLDAWGTITSGPYGTYNCRPPSLHGEGRAIDIGFEFEHGMPGPGGMRLVRFLKKYGLELGIQYIAWDGKGYSAKVPDGATWNVSSPHLDHVHCDQNWWAARNRDQNWWAARDFSDDILLKRPFLTISTDDYKYQNDDPRPKVVAVQDALNYVLDVSLKEDGYLGINTREAYAEWQRTCGFSGKDADGSWGETSLRLLARHSGSFRAA